MSASQASQGGSAGGGVLGAVGAIKQGQATQAADQYNATIANENADFTLQSGVVAAQNLNRRIVTNLSAEKAQYGASGIDAGQGSALDVMQQSAAQGARDLAIQNQNYAMKAFGYRSQSTLDQFAGDQAMEGAYYSAAGQIIQGAGQAVAMGA